MKATLIDRVFEPDMFESLRASAARVDRSVMRWEPDYNRWAFGDHEFFIGVHAAMVEQLSEVVGEPLKPSYCLLAKYADGGVVKMHRDRDCCFATLSVKLYGTEWPMYVAGEAFLPGDNQGVLFGGSEQYHYRDPIHSELEHCVILFHYARASYQGEMK